MFYIIFIEKTRLISILKNNCLRHGNMLRLNKVYRLDSVTDFSLNMLKKNQTEISGYDGTESPLRFRIKIGCVMALL